MCSDAFSKSFCLLFCILFVKFEYVNTILCTHGSVFKYRQRTVNELATHRQRGSMLIL